MAWNVEALNDVVVAEIKALPDDMFARFQRIADLIRDHGLSNVREPYIRHLQGKLWEMRMTGRDGISRAIYVTASGKQVIVVRVFIKKTQKTPVKEIKLALKRAKEVR